MEGRGEETELSGYVDWLDQIALQDSWRSKLPIKQRKAHLRWYLMSIRLDTSKTFLMIFLQFIIFEVDGGTSSVCLWYQQSLLVVRMSKTLNVSKEPLCLNVASATLLKCIQKVNSFYMLITFIFVLYNT